MSLNLYEILQKVLNESVGSQDVVDVINGHNYVEITYDDEKNHVIGSRLIQPYAYGLSMAGNEVLRAFQVSGASLRGEPAWKTYRLDRILSWRPRKQTFSVPPPMQGYSTNDYNEVGDGSMSTVYAQAKFDRTGDTLGTEREKTNLIKGAPKIATKNTQGPIPFASQQRKKNVFTSQPNSRKYAEYAKNIKDTENELNRFDDDIWARAETEKEQQDNMRIQNTAVRPKQAKQGPIMPKNNKDEND